MDSIFSKYSYPKQIIFDDSTRLIILLLRFKEKYFNIKNITEKKIVFYLGY